MRAPTAPLAATYTGCRERTPVSGSTRYQVLYSRQRAAAACSSRQQQRQFKKHTLDSNEQNSARQVAVQNPQNPSSPDRARRNRREIQRSKKAQRGRHLVRLGCLLRRTSLEKLLNRNTSKDRHHHKNTQTMQSSISVRPHALLCLLIDNELDRRLARPGLCCPVIG